MTANNDTTQSQAHGDPAVLLLLQASSDFGFATSLEETLERICRAVVDAQLFREAVVVIGDEQFRVFRAAAAADPARFDVLKAALKPWFGTPLRPFDFAYHSERVQHSWTLQHISDSASNSVSGWQDADQLVTPLLSNEGGVIGYLTLCRPHSGSMPTEATVRLVELVCRHGVAHILHHLHDLLLKKAADDSEGRVQERTLDLRAAQEKFSRLANVVADIVIVTDEQLTITYLNEAFAVVSGYSREEILGRNLRRLLEEIVLDPSRLHALYRLLDPNDPGVRSERVLMRTAQGETRTLELKIVGAVQGRHGKGLFVLARDYSERDKLFEHILASDKLAAGGRLSATLAHEINNPLQALLTQLTALQESRDLAPAAVSSLDAMRSAVDRMRMLTRNLLDVTRPASPVMQAMDLHEAIRGVAELLRAELQKSSIEFNLALAASVPAIMADRASIEQLILNLVINAMEAMRDGGKLTISTQLSGSTLDMAVRDTGGGVASDILDKMFEPFVTSKSGGSGLGLYVCKGIAERCGAAIRVNETGPAGTSISVSFPSSG